MSGSMDAGGNRAKTTQKGGLAEVHIKSMCLIYLWISCTKIIKMGWFKDVV